MKITPGMFRYHKYLVYLSAAFVGNSRFCARIAGLDKWDKATLKNAQSLRAFIEECPEEETSDQLKIVAAFDKADAVCAETLAPLPNGIEIRRTALTVHVPEVAERYDTEGEQHRLYVGPDGAHYWFDDALLQDLGTQRPNGLTNLPPATLNQSQRAGYWTTGDVAAFAWAGDVPEQCEAALAAALKPTPAPVTDAPVTVVTNPKRKPAIRVIDGAKPAKRVKGDRSAQIVAEAQKAALEAGKAFDKTKRARKGAKAAK